MPLSVLALCLLAGAIAYAYAWHYGYREGRIDGRLEVMSMQDDEGATYDSPYELDDPKHETYHDRYSELVDRERKRLKEDEHERKEEA